MKNENTLQRLKQYIDYKGLTNKDFEKSVGFSNGAFASQLKNNRTIGVDKLENILSIYTEINPEWLLTGKGKMLKDPQKDHKAIEESDSDYDLTDELIHLQRFKIDTLQKQLNQEVLKNKDLKRKLAKSEDELYKLKMFGDQSIIQESEQKLKK